MEIAALDVNISVKPVAAVAADVRRRTRLLAGGLNLGVKIRLLTSAATRLDDPVHELMGLPDDAFQGLYHFTVGGPREDARLAARAAYQLLDEPAR